MGDAYASLACFGGLYRRRYQISSVLYLLVIFLLAGCERRVAHIATSDALDERTTASFSDYIPGKILSWSKFNELGDIFGTAWMDADHSDIALQNLIDAIEPEATLALLRILTDSKTKIFYGSFTKEPRIPFRDDDFSFSLSHDGLIGFRVIRQLEVQTQDGPRLLSSIMTYRYANHQFVLRSGADVIRIRIELEPFRPGGIGIAGFSWFVEVGNTNHVVSVKGVPYLNASNKFKYDNVTPCGFPDHCNLCHHYDVRNNFSPAYINQPYERMKGFRDLLQDLRENGSASATDLAELEHQLNNPWDTFREPDLIDALLRRWSEIQR
jgi:hypothetical protein